MDLTAAIFASAKNISMFRKPNLTLGKCLNATLLRRKKQTWDISSLNINSANHGITVHNISTAMFVTAKIIYLFRKPNLTLGKRLCNIEKNKHEIVALWR